MWTGARADREVGLWYGNVRAAGKRKGYSHLTQVVTKNGEAGVGVGVAVDIGIVPYACAVDTDTTRLLTSSPEATEHTVVAEGANFADASTHPPTLLRPAAHPHWPSTQVVPLRLDLLLLALPLSPLLPATTKTQQAGAGHPMEAGTAFPLPSWVLHWEEWVLEVSACAAQELKQREAGMVLEVLV